MVLRSLTVSVAACVALLTAMRVDARTPGEASVIAAARKASPWVVAIAQPHATGSGVIVRSNGVIVTNAHVVGDEAEVHVKLADGRTLPGQVLGRDAIFDLAVIAIPARELPVAAFGDSDEVEVGEIAIVLGNPLGLDLTVTTGIVSAVNRDPHGAELGGLIQTDAAINPGNSGGPLLDSSGRVIGITASVLPGATGLGFAVPIDVVNDVVDQLLKNGQVVHAFLGISYSDIEPELAAQFRLPVTSGIIVKAVEPDSPAADAEVREHDIIAAVDGKAIAGGGDLRRIMRTHKPGETVRLTIVRGPVRADVPIELAQRTEGWTRERTTANSEGRH